MVYFVNFNSKNIFTLAVILEKGEIIDEGIIE